MRGGFSRADRMRGRNEALRVPLTCNQGTPPCIAQSICPFAIKSTWQIQLRCGRGLGSSADGLKAVVEKVGNSIAVVTKEVELQRATHLTSAEPIPSPAGELPPA
jgi:hypothetical protein